MKLFLRDSKLLFCSVLPWKKYNCGFSRAGIKAVAQSFSSMSGAVSSSVSGLLSLCLLLQPISHCVWGSHGHGPCDYRGNIGKYKTVTRMPRARSHKRAPRVKGEKKKKKKRGKKKESRGKIPLLGDCVFPNFQGLVVTPHLLANPWFPG